MNDRPTHVTNLVKLWIETDDEGHAQFAALCTEKDLDACRGKSWPHLAGYVTAAITTASQGTSAWHLNQELTFSDFYRVNWNEVALSLVQQESSKNLEVAYLKLLSKHDTNDWFLLQMREELIARGVW